MAQACLTHAHSLSEGDLLNYGFGAGARVDTSSVPSTHLDARDLGLMLIRHLGWQSFPVCTVALAQSEDWIRT